MHTKLHRKILSMCRVTRESGHWILLGSRTVWVSETQEVATTKRAAYAAFRGEVPEGMDVRANCGTFGCIAPEHAALCKTRRVARALSLPDQLMELAKSETSETPSCRDSPSSLPRGLTLDLMATVRRLSGGGSTLAQIGGATQLSSHEIMRIIGGVYSKVVKARPNSLNVESRFAKMPRREKSGESARVEEVPMGEGAPPEAESSGKIPTDILSMVNGKVVSEEERVWLEQISRG